MGNFGPLTKKLYARKVNLLARPYFRPYGVLLCQIFTYNVEWPRLDGVHDVGERGLCNNFLQ